MDWNNATTAADLIDILKAVSHNTKTPLDELVVTIEDSGFAYFIEGYDNIETEKGWTCILQPAK